MNHIRIILESHPNPFSNLIYNYQSCFNKRQKSTRIQILAFNGFKSILISIQMHGNIRITYQVSGASICLMIIFGIMFKIISGISYLVSETQILSTLFLIPHTQNVPDTSQLLGILFLLLALLVLFCAVAVFRK